MPLKLTIHENTRKQHAQTTHGGFLEEGRPSSPNLRKTGKRACWAEGVATGEGRPYRFSPNAVDSDVARRKSSGLTIYYFDCLINLTRTAKQYQDIFNVDRKLRAGVNLRMALMGDRNDGHAGPAS